MVHEVEEDGGLDQKMGVWIKFRVIKFNHIIFCQIKILLRVNVSTVNNYTSRYSRNPDCAWKADIWSP